MVVILGLSSADFFSLLKANPNPEDMTIVTTEFMSSVSLQLIPIMLLSYGVTCAWFYAVLSRIAPMAPESYKPLKPWTSIAIICIGIGYILSSLISYYFVENMMEGFFDFENPPDSTNPFEVFRSDLLMLNALSAGISLAVYGLLIFVCYQLAHAIKGAEVQRYIRSTELIGPFFALFFLFIGIWFVQPIINRLHEEGPGSGDNLDRSLILD